jgi:hypothetical protein
MSETTHYARLKQYLPRGYRLMIARKTGASISTINKVLRNAAPDNKGILVEAYRIASAQMRKIVSDAKEVARIQKELNKHAS